jgi:UDP-N-acetyl-D-mannosaminuronic acid dehydrogenase
MGIDKVTSDAEFPKVCVVGVGFVGLTLAISLCDAGFEVMGWEKNLAVSDSLALGQTEIIEPGIQEKLLSHVKSNRFSMINSALEATSAKIFIVTVGTPLHNSQIDLTHINQAIDQVIPALKDEDLLIVRSTTAIGTCQDLILPKLQQTNKRVRLAMCPERTVEGKALIEMTSLPQIVGASDEEGFRAASRFFGALGTEVIKVQSLASAELAKLINNTYRDLMFAFANEIAEVANAYGLNASEVIQAANFKYERSNISLPGISGGPCLEKDPWILVESGRKKGVAMEISSSARKVNERTLESFLKSELDLNYLPKRIAVLGLAFKGNPVTQDLRGSAIFPLVSFLNAKFPGVEIFGYEPAGIQSVPGVSIYVKPTLVETVTGADLVIMLTNAKQFENSFDTISRFAAPDCLVLDFWRRSSNKEFLSSQNYVSWAGE